MADDMVELNEQGRCDECKPLLLSVFPVSAIHSIDEKSSVLLSALVETDVRHYLVHT